MLGAVGAIGAAAAPTPGVAAFKKLSLQQLMEVEVTSVSRRPEVLTEAASAIQVVTGEDIRRAGAARIPQALRLLANLEVAQIDARQWAIAARGFNNTTTNKLLVQLDGRTLYTPLFSGVFWDVQDTLMLDLDRIEAISGPGATQWGSNAVNGVINIMTKSARETQGGLLTGGAGTEMKNYGALRYGGTLGPGLYYRVYVKRTEQDSATTPAGADAQDSWHTTQGGFRADWEPGTPDRLTLQGDAYRGRIEQAGNGNVEVSGANLLSRWTRTFGPRSELRVQAYVDFTRRLIPQSITENLYTYDLDLQQRRPIGDRHDLVWGAGYRLIDDEVRNRPTLAFLPRDVKHEWFSGFMQDEVRLAGDRLRLLGGFKLEHNPYTGAELQPSVRASWAWRPTHRVWAALSRAVRSPSRIDREFFVPAAPPFALAGGPSFVSEKLLAYELGYRAEPRKDLALALSTFFHDYDDLRSVEPATVAGGPFVVANGLQGKSYGAEFSADYHVNDRWRLRLGYTEQRVTSRPKPGSGDRTSFRSQALDPNRIVVLNSQTELSANTAVDVTARYVGRIGNQEVPAYLGLDVRVSWRPIESLELAVTGRNLLDRQRPEFGVAATRREIERSVNGSFTWRF
jgi:iron complex outermembrane receptor protein